MVIFWCFLPFLKLLKINVSRRDTKLGARPSPRDRTAIRGRGPSGDPGASASLSGTRPARPEPPLTGGRRVFLSEVPKPQKLKQSVLAKTVLSQGRRRSSRTCPGTPPRRPGPRALPPTLVVRMCSIPRRPPAAGLPGGPWDGRNPAATAATTHSQRELPQPPRAEARQPGSAGAAGERRLLDTLPQTRRPTRGRRGRPERRRGERHPGWPPGLRRLHSAPGGGRLTRLLTLLALCF